MISKISQEALNCVFLISKKYAALNKENNKLYTIIIFTILQVLKKTKIYVIIIQIQCGAGL